MKRIISLVLSVCLLFALAACGIDKRPSTSTDITDEDVRQLADEYGDQE